MKKKYIIGIIIILIVIITIISIQIFINKASRNDKKFLQIKLKMDRVINNIIPHDLKLSKNEIIQKKEIYNSMIMGADWILKMQEDTGRYNYWYDPIKNKYSKKNDDNFLRQAGTAYSMILVYEMTGDLHYLNSTKYSIGYLLNYINYLDKDKAYFLFNDKAKLGGISLPMLSMLKIKELEGSSEYDDILKKLANMIIYLQALYGTGQFKSTYIYRGDYEYEKNSGWESKIYPGEAMLALTYMYKIFKDEKYKKSTDYAMDFYYKNKWKSHAFLPWTISAFVLMYNIKPEKKYSDYVYFLTDHLLTEQNLDKNHYTYGSFHNNPSANTGSYLEGLGDAVYLTSLTGDKKRYKKYQHRAVIGYRWLLTLQYSKYNSKNLKNPEKAIGGFFKNKYNKKLRIDNTQHIISSFTKGLKYIYSEETVIKPKEGNGK